MTLTRMKKLALTVALFALSAVLVGVAGAAKGVGPLFAAWIPLLTVPWLLTRPEPGVGLGSRDASSGEPGSEPEPEDD